jgi:hypothetical protein
VFGFLKRLLVIGLISKKLSSGKISSLRIAVFAGSADKTAVRLNVYG